MTSVRNKDRFLDAAREVILTVGWRRATLADVARRADVSRMTIYRSYPDMNAMLADLMTREVVAEIAAVAAAVAKAEKKAGMGWDERIARRISGSVAALRDNALFRRIIDVDPEQLLPYLIDRRGRSQDAILDAIAAGITEAQESGEVRQGNPELLARTLLLAAHGFAISTATMVDEDATQADLDSELTTLVRRYLAP